MISTYGEPISFDRFIHPRVESEIAFLLGRDIHGPATVTSVLAATELVFGAVDVLDSRYQGFKFTLTDVVADNASAGAFYLGPIARPPDELDLRLLGCVVRVNGEVVMTAAGAAVMGHPAASVAWLANQLAVQGESLKAGQLIFSGGSPLRCRCCPPAASPSNSTGSESSRSTAPDRLRASSSKGHRCVEGQGDSRHRCARSLCQTTSRPPWPQGDPHSASGSTGTGRTAGLFLRSRHGRPAGGAVGARRGGR